MEVDKVANQNAGAAAGGAAAAGAAAAAAAADAARRPALGLEAMPPEILALILECLVPQPPEIGETRPVAYDQLMVDEPWFDFTRCRRGLYSVCLVSRSFAAAARPLLYRVIAVWDETAMVLLFRTLCQKPHYGLWTRYLSCHLTLTSESVIRETRRAITRHLAGSVQVPDSGVLATTARHFLMSLWSTLPQMLLSEGGSDHLPQALLCFLLMFLTKLETLLLQVPICDDHQEYDVLCAQVGAVKELFSAEPDAAPFQNIHTLLLQGDPELLGHFEDEDCDCELPEVWGAQPRRYWSLFASFPRLTTLEVSTDDGVWTNTLDEPLRSFLEGGSPPPPFLAGIRHIFLHNSGASPRDLHQLLLNAPDLETLYMASHPDGPDCDDVLDDGGFGGEAHPEALDVALAQHAKRLRNLDVGWEDIAGFESLVGPDGRLTALAEMESLQTLCIQLALLYGTPAAVAEAPLVQLLPPNLVELALEDWWWPNADLLDQLPDWTAEDRVVHYQSQHRYRVNALRTLTEFARDVRTRLHRLERVVLLCKIPWTWVMEGAIPIDFHFESVKRAFGEQGVEFSVSCDEVESSESNTATT